MRNLISLIILVLFLLAASPSIKANNVVTKVVTKNEVTKEKVNILLIVADDLGFGDIGANGSEISTPNIDALAASGSRFTNFYTQASCSPTRSMLLSGVDNHRNGMGTMSEDLLPHHKNLPGYRGYLNNEVVTVASLLQDVGYHTYMTGKWHLGYADNQSAHARGFQHTFSLVDGGGNHFNDQGMNAHKSKSTYRRDGKVVNRPEGYSSDLFTKELKMLIDERKNDKNPFFAYLSFTAPHFPLQAPKKTIDKYEGRYDLGWEVIREQRFKKMKAMGIIPSDAVLETASEELTKWSSLSKEEQKNESKKMAIYAAMIDNLDTNIGVILQYLKDIGEYENTVIMFLSDNGPDPYDRSERNAYQTLVSKFNYDMSYENMGASNSYSFLGPNWSQTSNVNQQGYKFLPTQGGIHNPVIMRFPGMLEEGNIMTEFSSILDITPTLLEIAGTTHPKTYYKGRKIYPLNGRSMLPYISGIAKKVYSDDETISFELFGHTSVFMGKWKAVKMRPPQGNDKWALYNIKTDLSESHDLSGVYPKILHKLTHAYEKYKIDNGVLTEPEGVTAYPAKPHYVKY
ncbi:arylsulfatase [Pseudocolwellia sp. HL-MZ19]|uniref:arylsulfatase n=1 Tax=Pseudocolwellia sp. HL-MZ19 TaxID=3400846 RepID=UPI003CF2A43F